VRKVNRESGAKRKEYFGFVREVRKDEKQKKKEREKEKTPYAS